MTLPSETTKPHHIVVPQPEAESTRSRDARDARARDESTSLADRIRERWKVPVVTEATRPAGGKSVPRTPFYEDLPSPRCVLEDYREGAGRFAGEAAGMRWLYWAGAVLPLAVNELCAAGHVASQRPGRFWAWALGVVLFILGLLFFT